MRIDEQLRQELARAYCTITQGWTLGEVVGRTGTYPARVSALRHGRTAGISIGRIVRMIAALGYDVEVVVRPVRRPDVKPRLPHATVVCHVSSAAAMMADNLQAAEAAREAPVSR